MSEREQPELEVYIGARIEARLRNDIQALADSADRTFSAEVRRALRLYVISENRKKAA